MYVKVLLTHGSSIQKTVIANPVTGQTQTLNQVQVASAANLLS